MDLLTAIHTRRAHRNYLDRRVSRETIATVIDAAIWAPSGINLQPWCFLVIDDPTTLAACSIEAKALIEKSSADHPELAAVRQMVASPAFSIFYNAPTLIIICATTPDEMATKDCCLAAENLMLAATAAGLGTCWIGLAEAWLNSEAARAELGIPTGVRPVAPIIVGYPAETPPATARRAADIRHVTMAAQT